LVRFLSAGDTALTVEFGDTADRRLSALVLALYRRLSAFAPPGLMELVPTLRSLTVHYDPQLTSADALSQSLMPLLDGLEQVPLAGRHWLIGACYAPEFAPDLEEVAQRTGLTREEVVRVHTGRDYRVYMLGFLPGFPYMGDLPKELQLPRRESPRVAVPAGSVAIATTLTAVYPIESPGGWHLIGRTPARLFDAARDPVVLLAPGDQVRFRAIERAEFDELDAAARAGRWMPVAQEAAP
jgi:KipI family sensor histidine kinase inhibitor